MCVATAVRYSIQHAACTMLLLQPLKMVPCCSVRQAVQVCAPDPCGDVRLHEPADHGTGKCFGTFWRLAAMAASTRLCLLLCRGQCLVSR